MSQATHILPPIPRESVYRLVNEAVLRERERCLRIVRGARTLDAFKKLDWPHLRDRIAKEIEKEDPSCG